MIMPTTSTRTHSKIKRIITKNRTIMVSIISGVIFTAPQVLSQSSSQLSLPAGDLRDCSSLFAIFFSEPETQKKNK
jgi:hypothetical protein